MLSIIIQKVIFFDYLIAKSQSVVVVAHRLHTVRNFDKIILMEEGKIASIGTHDELLKENVTYRYLYGSDNYGDLFIRGARR